MLQTTITKKELREMYEKDGAYKSAYSLGITPTWFYVLLGKNGIETKRKKKVVVL